VIRRRKLPMVEYGTEGPARAFRSERCAL